MSFLLRRSTLAPRIGRWRTPTKRRLITGHRRKGMEAWMVGVGRGKVGDGSDLVVGRGGFDRAR